MYIVPILLETLTIDGLSDECSKLEMTFDCSLRWNRVFLERTQILSGINFITHFLKDLW